MKLSVLERVLIMENLFVKDGDFVAIRAQRSIRKKIDLDTKEIAAIEFRVETDPVGRPGYVWDRSKEGEPKDVDFDSVEVVYLKGCVSRLDSEKHVTEHNFELCERINTELK